eukprot:gene7140-9742_t
MSMRVEGSNNNMNLNENNQSAVAVGRVTAIASNSINSDKDDIGMLQPADLSHLPVLPPNVKKWNTNHSLIWFQDVFNDMTSYHEHFHRHAMKGEDLLGVMESDLKEFGITSPLHVRRAIRSIKQLILLQQQYEKQEKESAAIIKIEANYIELKGIYESLSPDYQVAPSMEDWKPIDVYKFLADDPELEKFVKPMAINKIDGNGLIELSLKKGDLGFSGIIVNNEDTLKLKNAIIDKRRDLEKLQDAKRLENRRRFREGVVDYDKKSLTKKEIIDEKGGSFAKVYKGEYKISAKIKKIVAIKCLNDKKITNAKRDEENKEKYKFEYTEPEKSMLHEARILHRAKGPGVIEFFGVDITESPPSMITEYMARKSVEFELHRGESNEDSIFNMRNRKNVYESDTRNVSNPVLLQKIRILRDVAFALDRIHKEGIIHLDIASRNIFLSSDWKPKIGDFGLSSLEDEMKVQYECRVNFINEKHNVYKVTSMDTMKRAHFERDYLNYLLKKSPNDESLVADYKRHLNPERPARYMPYWAIYTEHADCRGINPKIDRHTDVYSFGCLMYELIVGRPPLYNIKYIEDVIQQKFQGAGNPIITADISTECKEIMLSCWNEYNEQWSMERVAYELESLHGKLAFGAETLFTKEGSKVRELYDKMREIKPKKAFDEVENYGNSKFMEHVNELAGLESQGVNPADRFKKDFLNLNENNIMLCYPPNTYTVADETLLTYLESGIECDLFEQLLNLAAQRRNHDWILGTMQWIYLDYKPIQIDAFCKCMDHLASIARDVHGSTDKDCAWLDISKDLVDFIRRIEELQEMKKPNVGEEVNKSHLQVMADTLRVISGLLLKKSLPVGKSSTPEIEEICDIIIRYLQVDYIHYESLQISALETLYAIGSFSTVILDRLYKGNVVYSLITILNRYSNDSLSGSDSRYYVIYAALRAIQLFPLQFLIDPKNVESFNATKGNLNWNGSAQSAETYTSTKLSSEEGLAQYYGAQWGEVYKAIFSSINLLYRIHSHGENEFAMEEEMVFVTALQVFNSCLSNFENEIILAEKFLFSVNEDDINKLIYFIRTYPEHFDIQKGVIELLRYILKTGKSIQVDKIHPITAINKKKQFSLLDTAIQSKNQTNRQQIDIRPIITGKDRLEKLLISDPKLRLLTKAMETFPLNDKVATGIDEKSTVDTHGEVSKGTITTSKTRSQTKMNTKGVIDDKNLKKDKENIHESFVDVLKQFDEESSKLFEVDSEGQTISAASLQTNAIMILGIACAEKDSGIRIQQDLIRSRYNESILLAFKNFKNSVELIENGCHALYSTCRASKEHQKILYELNILSYLPRLYLLHEQEWSVVNGIICAIVGLLEPSIAINEVENENLKDKLFTNAMQGTTAEQKAIRENSCIRMIEQLNTNIAHWPAGIWPAEKDDASFSLLQKLVFRILHLQIDVEKMKLMANFYRLLGCVAYWDADLIQRWENHFIVLSDSLIDTFTNLLEYWRTKKNEEEKDEKNKKEFEMFKRSIDFVGVILGVDSLTSFIMVPFKIHEANKSVVSTEVLEACMAIITAIMAGKYDVSKYPIGSELPYGEVEKLSSYRQRLVKHYGWVAWCLEVVRRKEPNPILIRHSLWILLNFISEKTDGYNAKLSEGNFDAHSIACDIAIKGGIEWAINVLKTKIFQKYYSLQSLSIAFLIWMEYHGRFVNRTPESLMELKDLLTKLFDRKYESYCSLHEEGYDTFLVGRTIRMFGELSLKAERLIGRIDSHLNEHKPVEKVTSCRLLSVRVSAVETEEDPTTHKPCKVYMLQVQWDKGSDNGEKNELKWRVARRFREFSSLRQDFLHHFDHLPPFDRMDESPLVLITSKNPFQKSATRVGSDFVSYFNGQSAEFSEKRKTMLQNWFDTLFPLRAALVHEPLLKFLEVPEHTNEKYMTPRLLPPLAIESSQHQIQSICYDYSTGIVIIGSGSTNPATVSFNDSYSYGEVSVYVWSRSLKEDTNIQSYPKWFRGDTSLYLVARQCFNICVISVAFDGKSRCVFVGLKSGSVIVYTLSDSYALVYSSEIEQQPDQLTNIALNSYNSSVIVGAVTGNFIMHNYITGDKTNKSNYGRARFTIIKCDTHDNMLFCGTKVGDVYVFDLAEVPSTVLFKVLLPNLDQYSKGSSWSPTNSIKGIFIDDNSLNNKEVTGLHFCNDTKLLYVSVLNHIFIWRIKERNSQTMTPELWHHLHVKDKIKISLIEVICGGQYVITCCSGGGVAVFDMSNEKSEDDYIAPSKEQQLNQNWNQIIRGKSSSIQEWLINNKIDCNDAKDRVDLIRIVANKAANVDYRTAAEFLMPRNPRKDVSFAWKLPKFVSCLCYLEDLRIIAFGSSDGLVQMVSLSDFIPTFEPDELKTSFLKPINTAIIGNLSNSFVGKTHQIVSPPQSPLYSSSHSNNTSRIFSNDNQDVDSSSTPSLFSRPTNSITTPSLPSLKRSNSVQLADRRLIVALLEMDEIIIFNGLIGKPNAAGLHKIRELVLTSKPRLVYIDLSINKIKGEINWDIANFPGLPQAIM